MIPNEQQETEEEGPAATSLAGAFTALRSSRRESEWQDGRGGRTEGGEALVLRLSALGGGDEGGETTACEWDVGQTHAACLD